MIVFSDLYEFAKPLKNYIKKLLQKEGMSFYDIMQNQKKGTSSHISKYITPGDRAKLYLPDVSRVYRTHHTRLTSDQINKAMRTLDQRASNIIASIDTCPTKPTLLITDGNHLMPFVATMAYAKKHKIPVIGTENSFLTNMFYMDKYGGISNEMLEMKEMWEKIQNEVKENKELVDNVLVSKSRGQVTHTLEYDFKPGPYYDKTKKTVLCLGQVDCDSVVCRDIGEFKNLDDFFSSVQIAVGNKYNLIVRLHPWDAKFHDDITYKYFSKFAKPETMIFKALEANTYSLIDNVADVVVTLTSQCGLEAAVAGKPVVTCGNAFYNVGGFTTPATKATLAASIDTSINIDHDVIRNSARKFLSFLMEKYMVDMTGKKDALILQKIRGAK